MANVERIHEVLQKKIESGELKLEDAQSVYDIAVNRYVNESSENNEETPDNDNEDEDIELTEESVSEYVESTKKEIYKSFFEGEITVEETQILLSVIDADNFVITEAADNDIPESAKKDIDPGAKKKQLAKKAALGAAAIATTGGMVALTKGIKSGKIDTKKIGAKVGKSAANVANKVSDAGKKVASIAQKKK